MTTYVASDVYSQLVPLSHVATLGIIDSIYGEYTIYDGIVFIYSQSLYVMHMHNSELKVNTVLFDLSF